MRRGKDLPKVSLVEIAHTAGGGSFVPTYTLRALPQDSTEPCGGDVVGIEYTHGLQWFLPNSKRNR